MKENICEAEKDYKKQEGSESEFKVVPILMTMNITAKVNSFGDLLEIICLRRLPSAVQLPIEQ